MAMFRAFFAASKLMSTYWIDVYTVIQVSTEISQFMRN